jgi:RNA polymerase sigma factor (sigma-70 family)
MTADADDPREADWISRAVVCDDHAQDCFLKAWRHLRSFQGRGRFVGWLLRIAWQCFIDSRRRAGAEAGDTVFEDDVASADAGPEREADVASLKRRLAALRPAEAAAIQLHYQHGQSHAEIAETLGLPLGTIKSLILRARDKLRRDLHPSLEEHR